MFKFTFLRACSGCSTVLDVENKKVFREFLTFFIFPCNHALPVLSQNNLPKERCRLDADRSS